MTATPIAAVWLRDVLLDALDDAISARQGEYASCPACAARTDGTSRGCPDHEAAQALVIEYMAAAVLVRMAATDEDMAALLHGTDRETAPPSRDRRRTDTADEQQPCRAHPDDCPNGPEPHAYYNPPEFEGRMCCCRQPDEEMPS